MGVFFDIVLDLCNYSLELTKLTQAGLQLPGSYLSLLGTRITGMSDHVYLFVCLRQSHVVQASTELLIFLFLTKECRDYRHMPLHLTILGFLRTSCAFEK